MDSDGVRGIATINADGSDFQLVVNPDELREQPRVGAEAPRWTPDHRILFDSNRAGGPDDWHLFLVDAAVGEPRLLTNTTNGSEWYGAFSLDGTQLAYSKGFPTGDPASPIREAGIFLADGNGQNERELTTPTEGTIDEWADFSPDGTQVAFTRHLGGEPGSAQSAIFVVNVDGSGLHSITPASLNALRPRWSPDGERIVFSSNADNFASESANSWIVAADGSGLRQLTFATIPSQGFFPDFSADGEHIVYLNHTGGSGTQDLAILSLNGSAHCILWGGTGHRMAGDMDWGPSPTGPAS